MTHSEIKELKLLKEKISNLEIIECGMVHEKVKFDGNNNPTKKDAENFNRNSLCPAHIRNNRIGCGHTMVRTKLKEILNNLANYTDQKNKINELIKRLNNLDAKIGAVDHKKGHLEKEYAEIIEENSNADLSKINTRINNTIQIHNKYLNEADVFKKDLIGVIDQIISISKPKSFFQKLF